MYPASPDIVSACGSGPDDRNQLKAPMTEAPTIDKARLGVGPIGRAATWLLAGEASAGLVALAGLAAFVFLLTNGKIFTDGDTFWHLAAGDWILRHGAVPSTDPFSYTFPGAPWQAHEWLAEVVMSLTFRAGGWSGLSVLFAAAFGATALILGDYLRRWLAPGPLMLAMGLALASGAPSLLARPHLLALPLLALWGVGLLRARDEGRTPHWSLLVVMLAWANLHGSFLIGLALIAPLALEALVENRRQPWPTILGWGLFGLCALAAALVTPHGVQGLLFPLKVSGMTSLPIIVEWRSSDFGKPSVFEIAILGTLFLGLWRGVRVPAIRLLLLLGLLHMALQHMRHQAVFAVLAALLLAEPFARNAWRAKVPAATKARTPLAALLTVGLVAVAAGAVRLERPIVRTDALLAPISGLASVPLALARQPMFNEYGFGGYLIFKGVRPFIDGRADMYGDPFMHLYAAMARPDRAVLVRELETRHITWTILRPSNPAVAVMDGLPGWRRLHTDRFSVVHVRRDAEAALPVAQP
jgi:hypothetical protein